MKDEIKKNNARKIRGKYLIRDKNIYEKKKAGRVSEEKEKTKTKEDKRRKANERERKKEGKQE